MLNSCTDEGFLSPFHFSDIHRELEKKKQAETLYAQRIKDAGH